MEKLVIKMINKPYEGAKDLSALNRYIVGKGKNRDMEPVRYYGSKGVSRDIKAASNDMFRLLNYSKRPGKRKVYHIIFSFPDYIEDANPVRIAIEEVAKEIFDEGYCLVYGIHESKRNLHAHFSIMAVNYLTGRKWHMKKGEFEAWKKRKKELIKDILREYNVELFD